MYHAAMKSCERGGAVRTVSVGWFAAGRSADRWGGGGSSAGPGKLCWMAVAERGLSQSKGTRC
jgi:hypothetical protein